MTVKKNVTFGPKMHGVDTAERQRRADELLELLDIEELADRDPTTLSGGQQQRVGLARALAIEPHVLLLDEPMTGLDAKLKRGLRRELGELLDELDVTTLYVTHDQEEAMVMCDRIAVMNAGRIEQIGSPKEIYERPANEFVAGFVGSANLLEATAGDGHVDLGFVELDAPDVPATDGDVTVIVRPRDVTVGRGSIDVEIIDLYYAGDEIQATGTLPDGRELELRLHGSGIGVGDTVPIEIDPERVHVVGSAE